MMFINHFLFAIHSNLAYITFLFQLLFGLRCKPEYRANTLHHLIFLTSFFSFKLPAVRMSFTASPKDVQSARQGLEAEEVWREEKSHKH